MVPLPSVVRNSEYCAVKVAVTLLVESIVTTQVALLPAHAPPDQPVNTKLGSAVAVRVTEVPARYCHEVDDGWAVTVPVPSVVTNSEYCAVNVAVTLLAESIVTVQVALLPERAPDQPVNAKPGSGRAVRDTAVPALYMPVADAGWGEIVPDPAVPRLSMNRGGGGGPAVANAPKTDGFGPTPMVFTTAFVTGSITDTVRATTLTT